MLFTKKKERSFNLYVDYRKLNSVTIKNKYSLPHIDDLVISCKDFVPSLGPVCHNVEWALGVDREAIGLKNVSAALMGLVNRVCKLIFDPLVVVFIDDVLVYS